MCVDFDFVSGAGGAQFSPISTTVTIGRRSSNIARTAALPSPASSKRYALDADMAGRKQSRCIA